MNKKTNENKTPNSSLLTRLFTSFVNGLRAKKAVKPKQYLETKKLDFNKLEIGFNSGQFHHRKSESFRKPYIDEKVLVNSTAPVNAPDRTAYSVFAPYSVVFPLKNRNSEIVNYYATRIKLAEPVSLYLNEFGVYPQYPQVHTKRLFLTHDVYDSATVLQSNTLKNEDSVLSLRNGALNHDLLDAISTLELIESIHILSKNEQVEISKRLEEITDAHITTVLLPTGKSLNDIWCNDGVDAVYDLLNKNTEVTKAQMLSFEDFNAKKEAESINDFTVLHAQHFKYKSHIATYEVKGKLPKDLGSMRVSIKAHFNESVKNERFTIELFNTERIEKYAETLNVKHDINANSVLSDLTKLSEYLEAYRDEQVLPTYSNIEETNSESITPSDKIKAIEFLKSEDLLRKLDERLELTGVVGEERTRMLLFVVASSLISSQPLHAIVQASSGAGKSHLVNAIMACIPQTMCINSTSISSKGFNHFGENALMNKLFVIQDFDGLDDKALFAFRELQSAKSTSNIVSTKSDGDHRTIVKQVNANFSSLVATTKQDIYYDNQSRSIIVGIDESNEQTQKIITHSNRFYAGLIDKSKQEESKFFLQNCIKVMKSFDVVNHYATQLQLPSKAKMQRRLNHQFQEFILQITRLHQYQREIDSNGRLITTIEDIKLAIDLFFDAIILKIDELSSSTRQFFEELKIYVASADCKSTSGEFKQIDVRRVMNLSKTQVAHHLKVLIDLEYLTKVSGSVNRGFTYKITYADNNNKMQKEVKDFLLEQVNNFTKQNTETL